MANNTLQIGVVSAMQGEAFARSPDGVMRRLVVGGALYLGDVIVTANGSAVDVTPNNAPAFSVGEQQTVVVDTYVMPVSVDGLIPVEAGKADVAVNPATGLSLDALLEEEAAAAGLTGGDAESGHSFVDLTRIVEQVPTVGYDFPVNPSGKPPEITGMAGIESNKTVDEPHIEPPPPPPPPPPPEASGYGWFIAHKGNDNVSQSYQLTEGTQNSHQATATFNVQFQERGEAIEKILPGETVTVVLDVSGTAGANDFAILGVSSHEFDAAWALNNDATQLTVTLTNDTEHAVNLQGIPFDVKVQAVLDQAAESPETLNFDIRSASIGSVWESNDEVLYQISDTGLDIRGNPQDNLLLGRDGNDTLTGKGGDDEMSGGAGADTYVWNLADLGTVDHPAHDTLTDFNGEKGDRLDLSSVLDGTEYSLVAAEQGGKLLLQVTDEDANVVQSISVETVLVTDNNEAVAALDSMLATDQIIRTG